MTLSTRQGLYRMPTLTDLDLAEIQQLARICEDLDQIDLRLNWDALKWRTGEEVNDFAYYPAGALLGLLTLDGLGFDEAEGTGMVHPEHRCAGVFRALVDAARDECRAHSTEALILFCDHRSPAAPSCAAALGARH